MSEYALTWQSEIRGDVRIVSPQGRVDESTADAFRDGLVEAAESGSAKVVVDLNSIAYMSSRGLRALTLAQRAGDKVGTTIVLARPNDIMREILAISRYDLIFRVTETVEEALAD